MPNNSIFSMAAVNKTLETFEVFVDSPEVNLDNFLPVNYFAIREGEGLAHLTVDYHSVTKGYGSIDFRLTVEHGWMKCADYKGAISLDSQLIKETIQNVFKQIHQDELLVGMTRLDPVADFQSQHPFFEGCLLNEFYLNHKNHFETPKNNRSVSEAYTPTANAPALGIHAATSALATPLASAHQQQGVSAFDDLNKLKACTLTKTLS